MGTPPSAPAPAQKSYLAAFLLALFLGVLGTNRLYTGHLLLGWLRAGVLLVSIVAPALLLIDTTFGLLGFTIAGFASTAVTLWWYVDLWLYYLGDVTDAATGQPLVQLGPKDKQYARSLMIGLHLAIVLIPIATIIFIAVIASQLQQALPNIMNQAQGSGLQDALNGLSTQ